MPSTQDYHTDNTELADARRRYQSALRSWTDRRLAYNGLPTRKEVMRLFITDLKLAFEALFRLNHNDALFKELYTSGSPLRCYFEEDGIVQTSLLPRLYDAQGRVCSGYKDIVKSIKREAEENQKDAIRQFNEWNKFRMASMGLQVLDK